ncbi:hypothetical protein AME01nite_28640 [Acidomonas methanolica NBRC 104435]|nr:hypothetical protein EDC31_1344 [Acidomonas methanolica]GEL00366.1 hypothetical protein AME01nite_28640 [Acidomonas methanolica NBRC 104435]
MMCLGNLKPQKGSRNFPIMTDAVTIEPLGAGHRKTHVSIETHSDLTLVRPASVDLHGNYSLPNQK